MSCASCYIEGSFVRIIAMGCVTLASLHQASCSSSFTPTSVQLLPLHRTLHAVSRPSAADQRLDAAHADPVRVSNLFAENMRTSAASPLYCSERNFCWECRPGIGQIRHRRDYS